MYQLKNDRFRKARGGKAFVVTISCRSCGQLVLTYQKDGDGPLKRCYLNRILAPEVLAQLQHDQQITQPEDMPSLYCPGCHVAIGAPIRHHDGRLAFGLRRGGFVRRRVTS